MDRRDEFVGVDLLLRSHLGCCQYYLAKRRNRTARSSLYCGFLRLYFLPVNPSHVYLHTYETDVGLPKTGVSYSCARVSALTPH